MIVFDHEIVSHGIPRIGTEESYLRIKATRFVPLLTGEGLTPVKSVYRWFSRFPAAREWRETVIGKPETADLAEALRV